MVSLRRMTLLKKTKFSTWFIHRSWRPFEQWHVNSEVGLKVLVGPEDLDREDLQEYLHNIHENNLDSESLIEDSLDNVHKIYMDYFNRPHDIRLDDNVIVLDNGAEESLMHSLNIFINENIYEADEPINIGGVSEDWGLLIVNEGETIFGQSSSGLYFAYYEFYVLSRYQKPSNNW